MANIENDFHNNNVRITSYDNDMIRIYDNVNDFDCKFSIDCIDDFVDFISWIAERYKHCSNYRTGDALPMYIHDHDTELLNTYTGNYIQIDRIGIIKDTILESGLSCGNNIKIFTKDELRSMSIERLHKIIERKEKKHETSCSC